MVRSILAVLTALLAAPAFAQGDPSTKLYVSADFGSAENGVSEYVLGTATGPRDGKSNAIRVRFGYQFVRWFALEAGYADLGSYSANIDMDCSSAPEIECIPDFRSDVDLTGWTINGAGVLPIGERFALRANLGWILRRKQSHLAFVEGDDVRRSSQKLLPHVGAGASFAVTKKVDVFAEWAKYMGDEVGMGGVRVAGGITDESDLESVSLGMRWRF